MNKRFQPLSVIILLTLLVGLFFRFYNLDGKIYWHDEVFTSLRSAGYIGETLNNTLKQQGVFMAADLQQYQRLSPEYGWGDTLISLQSHPEHPPLYYLGTRLWMELFGSSVAVTRSLAAAISLLAFPCLYWLCLEIFQSRLVGSVAMALFAVSPFQVLYAQEARQYSLWTVMVLLSSATLLWARRQPTLFRWVAYGATVALGLYTSLFFVLTLLSHGLYLIGMDEWRRWRGVGAYLAATLIGLCSFVPWMMVMEQNYLEFQKKTSWTKAVAPLDFLAKLWGLHLSSGFLDLGFPLEHPYTYLIPPLAIVLILWASWIVYRHTEGRVWLFIGLMIGVNAATLVIPDLVWGGIRSASSRYFVPMYLGVQLLVAYLVAHWLTHPRASRQRWGQMLLAGLVVSGIVSCAISAQANTWWNKGVSYGNPTVARVINAAHQPIVLISTLGDALGNAISLSYVLKPDVKMQFVEDPAVPTLPSQTCEIFLFYPSDDLQQTLVQNYPVQIEPFEFGYGLSRVQRADFDC
jgi:uncharacterized membrane protein